MNVKPKPQQLIFFGAPGTGKSHRVKAHTVDKKQFRVTIHPEYTYSDFTGQLLPTNDTHGNIIFSFMPGPLTKALQYAFEHRDEEVALILEELSRGNVAAIFGDLFQLLDRDPNTWNSLFPVHNTQISSFLPEIEENIATRTPDNIFLPANLSIYATVNTSDQNVVPMDTAFKRRFDWQYVTTSPIKDENSSEALNNPAIQLIRDNGTYIETDWITLYQNVNKYILSGNSPLGVNEDKQVGQFFIKFDDELITATRLQKPEAQMEVRDQITNKLLMYLWEDVEGRNNLVVNDEKRLFKPEITSYGQLYSIANSNQVFSDFFYDEYFV